MAGMQWIGSGESKGFVIGFGQDYESRNFVAPLCLIHKFDHGLSPSLIETFKR